MSRRRFTHSGPYKPLLEMLVQARTRAGLTPAELAARLGRPQPFISYIECSELRLDVIEFHAIMRALDSAPDGAFRELIAKLPNKLKIGLLVRIPASGVGSNEGAALLTVKISREDNALRAKVGRHYVRRAENPWLQTASTGPLRFAVGIS